jgi:N-acetyl sugar amidotransferase
MPSESESVVKTCSHCILDTNDDPSLSFDANGVCYHCSSYEEKFVKNAWSDEAKWKKTQTFIQRIKEESAGNTYDCLIGVSGGIDSSYLVYLAKQYGLNPLLVHFDNGWNSELAVENITRMVNYSGFDLFTYVVDWEEFKSLQLAYIRASVIDWEIPTDHGFYTCLYQQAKRHKIKFILTGHNYQTEYILPKRMRWSKLDAANIKDIYKRFGDGKKLKSFPLWHFTKAIWNEKFHKLERINFLNYQNYTIDSAKQVIKDEMGWREYPAKHFENIFTRFYQGYVLPEKFKVNKRKAHLSNLICSGQITRERAIQLNKAPFYESNEQLLQDIDFFKKKLGISDAEFDKIMKEPERSHLEFESYETGVYPRHEKIMNWLRPFRISKRLKR